MGKAVPGTPNFLYHGATTCFDSRTKRAPVGALLTFLLARDVSSPFCLVTALIQYCKVRGDRPGPLFCHANQTSISVYQFNIALLQCLSLRFRHKSLEAEQGYSDAQIRALGRWKLDAFKVYLRLEILYAN